MNTLLPVVLVGIPLAWLVAFAAYAYLDAPKHGMNPRKWAAISFFVPLFGFFAYLFERDERDYDHSEDPYAAGDGAFAIHESRRGEKPLGPAGTTEDESGGRGVENGKRGVEEDGHGVEDGKRGVEEDGENANQGDGSNGNAEPGDIGEERNEPSDV